MSTEKAEEHALSAVRVSPELHAQICLKQHEAPYAPRLPSLRDLKVSVTFVANRYAKVCTSLPDVPILGLLNSLLGKHVTQRNKHLNALIWGFAQGRKGNSVDRMFALVYDFDGGVTADEVANVLRKHNVTFLIHSSYSSGDIEKFRVIIFLMTPIPLWSWEGIEGVGTEGYTTIYKAAAPVLFDDLARFIDPSCCTASKLFYLPAVPENPAAEPFFEWGNGVLFDWRPVWEREQQLKSGGRIPRAASSRTPAVDASGLEVHLNHLEPDHYDDWLLGLMVIRNELGDTAEALELAHEWSARSEKYDPSDTESKWSTLADSPRKKRTLGTLIWRIRRDKPDYLQGARTFSTFTREEIDALYDSI